MGLGIKSRFEKSRFLARKVNPLRKQVDVFLPRPAHSVGGPSTFMRNLCSGLGGGELSYTHNVTDQYQAILFPIQFDRWYLERLKQDGVKVVQRLDGVYYPPHFSDEWVRLNEPVEDIYKHFADHVIFQSKYSQKQCELILGKSSVSYSVVYNGCDINRFYPLKKSSSRKTWNFITTANFRTIDMIEPVILALDELWKERKDFTYTCIGPIADPNLQHFFERPYLKYLKAVDVYELPKFLQQADLYLFSYLNPNCPNSVIEAISCGLPVVSFASGSMSELCVHQGELLADVEIGIIQKYENFSHEKFLECLYLAMSKYEEFLEKALVASQNWSSSKMVKSYIQQIKKCLS